jgi:formylglycine-generating enzyme required for sulfatase activity
MKAMPDSPLARILDEARARTDELFQIVDRNAWYERPIPERHRIVFYLGHLEAFDWNLLCRRELDLAPFHPSFDKLFAFGIDPPVGELPSDKPSDWPSIAEIERYNRRVRERVDEALARVPRQLFHVAVEHRLMHAETLAYMLHWLPPAQKAGRQQDPHAAPPARQEMIPVPAGPATLGRPSGDGFGWDHEFERHTVHVPAFRIEKFKVSNARYLEFVKAGGPAPAFWIRDGGGWRQRTMFGEVPLPLDWPVWVTQEQASAYAAWKGRRLPDEAEYHRALGCQAPLSPSDNVDFRRWDPSPVSSGGDSETGVRGLAGNGWEWTSSVFAPFHGFVPFPFYPGYSANFFDGQHYVLKGGSPRTAACFLRPSFRNWFRPNYPYVYAGFRCCESDS